MNYFQTLLKRSSFKLSIAVSIVFILLTFVFYFKKSLHSSTSITIRQDGKIFYPKDNEVSILKTNFEFEFNFKDASQVNLGMLASPNEAIFRAAKQRDLIQLSEYFCGGCGLAEDRFNEPPFLSIGEKNGFHFLYFEGENDHRFNSIRKGPSGLLASRLIPYPPSETNSPETLYFVFMQLESENPFITTFKINFRNSI